MKKHMRARTVGVLCGALGLAAVTGGCRKEESLEELLANPQLQASPASADEVLGALNERNPHQGANLDLPRPPMTDEPAGAPATIVAGTILETMDASNYTYLRLKLADGAEDWAAVTRVPVKVGDGVQVAQSMVMTDFHSSTLNRTFPRIIFGTVVGTGPVAAAPAPVAPQDAVHGAHAQAAEEAPTTFSGTVLETVDASSYTYLRLKTDDGVEEWAAVNRAALPTGTHVKLQSSVVMHDFYSSTLKRTFPRVVFATLVN